MNRMFRIEESEHCALVEDFQAKLPPLCQEHTDNLRAAVNWVKQGILPPPSPPQYNLPPRPPFLRSPSPPPYLATKSSRNNQEQRQNVAPNTPAGREEMVTGTVESERECLPFEPPSVGGTDVRTPEQQRLSCGRCEDYLSAASSTLTL